MIDRFADSDGLGAIFPPMIWSIVALQVPGLRRRQPPSCSTAIEQLDGSDHRRRRHRPAAAVQVAGVGHGHRAAGARPPAACRRATRRRTRPSTGCWIRKSPAAATGRNASHAEPGGWCFEYAQRVLSRRRRHGDGADGPAKQCRPTVAELPPQCELDRSDATSRRNASPTARRLAHAASPALASAAERWMLAMQNRDGGWGAFDRDNDSEFLCHVPFADHNAMIDPSTPDLTGRVLEALGLLGAQRRRRRPSIAPSLTCAARKKPTAVGSAAGASTISTAPGKSLVGLAAVGVPTDDPMMRRGAQLAARASASLRRLGRIGRQLRRARAARPRPGHRLANRLGRARPDRRRPARPSGRRARHAATCSTRSSADGSWDEAEFTGTGFPRVFYLRYHFYPIYFPLLALATLAVRGRSQRLRRQS